MQNEFDKEIDALLRKAVTGDVVAVPETSHLDADEISMFAENALVGTPRDRAISHFSDCERCRGILASVVALNAEEGIEFLPVTETSAAAVVASEEPSSFWQSLFSVRNLALSFGALTLAFAGFLGFTAWTSSQGVSEMAQADKQTITPRDDVSPNSNSSVADSDEKQLESEADSEGLTELQENAELKESPTSVDDEKRGSALDQSKRANKRSVNKNRADPSDEPAFAPAELSEKESTKISGGLEAERKPDERSKDDDESLAKDSVDVVTESREEVLTTRGATPRKREAAKAPQPVTSGSTVNRSAPPVKAKKKPPARRTVSGKTFVRKAGGWFDVAYKNQRPTVVSRGTTAYGNLDAGLRAIGNRLPGTVYVIWKSKAYKIQ